MTDVETRFGKVEGFRSNGALAFPGIPLLGDPLTVAEDPYGEERAVWDNVEAALGGL
jgi:hypothetical protein